MLSAFKKIISLKSRISKLETENKMLKHERSILISSSEKHEIEIEDEFQRRLNESIEINNEAWIDRNKKLLLKMEIMKEEISTKEQKIRDLHDEITDQRVYLEKLSIELSPFVVRREKYNQEEIKNSKEIEQRIQSAINYLNRRGNNTIKLLEKLD